MKRSRTAKSFTFDLFLFFTCICASFISSRANNRLYHYIWLLPLAYGIIYFLFLSTVIRRQFSIFTAVLMLMSYVRYVLLPVGMVLSGKYSGKSLRDPSANSVLIAIMLMIYELLALSLFLLYLSKKNNFDHPNKNVDDFGERVFIENYSNGGKLVFVAFGFFSLALVAMIPHTIVNFNFIVPTASTIRNMSNTGTMEQIATVCLSVTKQFILLSIAIKCYKLNKRKRRILWKFIALIAVLLNSCIYTGTNRSDFILMTIASFLFYLVLFPSMKKVVVPLICVIIGVAVPALSAFRQTGIIDFSNGFNGLVASVTDIMWGYSGGPYNVAIAIESAHMYPEGRNIFNLIYDFLRPTFGINLIMQKLPFTYSNAYFNYRYYMAERITQIMPMVGEGYFYFGVFGAPLITMFFGWLGIKLSDIRKRTYNPMILYFLTITCCRLGFIMGQNATIQMNDLSFNLFVPIALIYLSKTVSIRSR